MIISELYYSFRQTYSWFRASKQWFFFFELCWSSFHFTCYLNLPCLYIVDGLTMWREVEGCCPWYSLSLECFVDSPWILWFLTFLKHFCLWLVQSVVFSMHGLANMQSKYENVSYLYGRFLNSSWVQRIWNSLISWMEICHSS